MGFGHIAALPARVFALKSGVLVFLNGEFVPEDRAVISVFDRSFLYGDGLFETIRVFNGKPFRRQQHLERLQRGSEFLNIKLPFSPTALEGYTSELIAKNRMPDALLRLTLSRGVGVRGYSPKGADTPSVVMSLHPAPSMTGPPPRWKLITSSHRLPANEPLAQFKTCNKLAQILARAEADAAGADEALLLNTDGFVVEGASSNLFWIQNGAVCTAPLAAGVLPGVTRAVVFEICRSLGQVVAEGNVRASDLKSTEGVFVSLSSFGIVEGASVDGEVCRQSPLPAALAGAYRKLLERENA